MPRLILGHTTNNSIKIWVRGSERWPVAFIDVLDSANRRTKSTRKIQLDVDDFYTYVAKWDGLGAGSSYQVKVSFGKSTNDTEEYRIRDAYTHGRFRTFPSDNRNSKFSFLLGSCNLHSLGLIKNPDEVWLRVSQVAKDNDSKFMIHCGDQIYADIPFRPVADPAHYRNKYLDAWGDCRSMQKFLTESPHYMILDDHEITNNFHRGLDKGDEDYESLMRVAMKVYYEFQHKHNPDTVVSPRQYNYKFNYGNNQFYAMDTRFWREQQSGQIINEEQMKDFKEWLLTNKAKNKFVISSVPFIGQVKSPKKDKWCDPIYKRQRDEIIDHIADHAIGKMVFLTGDMHNSYHAKMSIVKGVKKIVIHELMSSPLNQFTPDVELDNVYISPYTSATLNGVTFESKITPSKFYGNHSNVMAVEVEGAQIKYRVYRTRKEPSVAKRGSFIL